MKGEIKCVLMDIEGTTTSVSFVYDVLFPYFLANIDKLLLNDSIEVVNAFEQVNAIVKGEGGMDLHSRQDGINQLVRWCKEDRKVTPLKFLQGIIWEEGYLSLLVKLRRSWKVINTQETAVYKGFRISLIKLFASL